MLKQHGQEKQNLNTYTQEIIEEKFANEIYDPEIIEEVKNYIFSKNGIVSVEELTKKIKEYSKKNESIKFENLRKKMADRGVIDINNNLVKTLKKGVNNVEKKQDDDLTQTVKLLIPYLILLDGYKNTLNLNQVKNNITTQIGNSISKNKNIEDTLDNMYKEANKREQRLNLISGHGLGISLNDKRLNLKIEELLNETIIISNALIEKIKDVLSGKYLEIDEKDKEEMIKLRITDEYEYKIIKILKGQIDIKDAFKNLSVVYEEKIGGKMEKNLNLIKLLERDIKQLTNRFKGKTIDKSSSTQIKGLIILTILFYGYNEEIGYGKINYITQLIDKLPEGDVSNYENDILKIKDELSKVTTELMEQIGNISKYKIKEEALKHKKKLEARDFDFTNAIESIKDLSIEDESEGFKEARKKIKNIIINNRNLDTKRIVEGIQNTIRGQRNDINNLPAPEYYERELYGRIGNKKKATYDINPMLWINKLKNEIKNTTDKIKRQKKGEIKDNSINYLIICTIMEQGYIAKIERVSKCNWLGTRTEDNSEVKETVEKYKKMKKNNAKKR